MKCVRGVALLVRSIIQDLQRGGASSQAYAANVCMWGSAAVSALRLVPLLADFAHATQHCSPASQSQEAGAAAARECTLLATQVALRCAMPQCVSGPR